MVCQVNNIVCCVADPSKSTHVSLLLPAARLVADLFEEVARRLQYKLGTFELSLAIHNGDTWDMINLSSVKEKSLEEVGMRANSDRNKISLIPLSGERSLVGWESPMKDDLTAPAAPLVGDPPPEPPPPPPPPTVLVQSNRNRYSADSQFKDAISSSPVPYVGLVNQAMTCYLNSLLQALFMTPEFRNALYHWEYDGSLADENNSMPYQLQKLFLNLQTSTRTSVETTALTRSFGWDSSEAWQQHDIQELCRVMFDALEQKFKNTDQADLINRLYEGTMTDYVKCLECSTEKHREDKFLDIPLPVRPFGSAVAYGSVEEALHAFVLPETLEGNNQYYCERCQKKCDAHKGLKFTKFPYLLTLHLKRFDFDYNTLNRIKLNDKVSFPEKLNLNGLIVSNSSGDLAGETAEEAVKCDDSSTTDSGSALDEDNAVDTPSANNHTDYQEDDEGIDLTNTHESEKNRFNAVDSGEAGPYIYELFSIMIHSGSASGGHYYAYIKDFNLGDWYCFNDQSVSRITHDDIRKTYGGGRGYYAGAYSSSTNAYMLMYRQIDSARNATAMTQDEFPPHIHELLRRIEEQKEVECRIREREQEMLRIKCYFPSLSSSSSSSSMQYYRLTVKRDATLKETTREALQCANLEGSVPIEQCRLVSFDGVKGTIECSFEGREEESISDILNSVYKSDLLLEVRDKDQTFQVYRHGDITTKVMVINPVTEEMDRPICVRGNLDATVAEYRAAVATALQTDPDSTNILLEKYNSEPQLVTTMQQTLRSAGFFANNRVFAFIGPLTNLQRIQRIAELAKHIITLNVTLPTVTKEALVSLNIPSLEEGCNLCRQEAGAGDHERDASPQPLPDPEDSLAGPPSDQSASEDSSLTDSERTIVGEAPEHSPEISPRNSPVAWEPNTSSPENEDEGVESKVISWNRLKSNDMRRRKVRRDHADQSNEEDEDYEARFFRATPYQEGSTLMLSVLADKRMSVRRLKENLRPHVGVCVDYFKLFRINNGQETECTRSTETLKMSRDEDHLIVRLGRALRKGERAGKVYLLDLKDPQPEKFLIEWVIATGAPVQAVKQEILSEVQRKCGLDIPLNRCRLRLKKWHDPCRPYLDDAFFTDITGNWDLYLQELEGPEPVTSADQTLMFVRQWCPSTLELRPLAEVVLETNNVSELKHKISELSGIPLENIEISKGKTVFPSTELSLYRIHSDMDWNLDAERLDDYPLHINIRDTGGIIIYYRDSREKLKAMTHEERRELVSLDRRKTGVRPFSQKKERALKIYVDSTPPRRRDDCDVD